MTKSLLPRVENKRGRICETGPTDRSIFPSTYCEFLELGEILFLRVVSFSGETIFLVWFSGSLLLCEL